MTSDSNLSTIHRVNPKSLFWINFLIGIGILAIAAALDVNRPWSVTYLLVILYSGFFLHGWVELVLDGIAILSVFIVPLLFRPESIWQGSGLYHRTQGALAVVALIALMWERRRYVKGLQRANNELEQKVHARTSDLQTANQSLRLEIADREKFESQLIATEERLASIFKSCPVGMCITTIADGTVLEMNDVVCEMGRCKREEVLGRNALELGYWLVPDERKHLVREIMEKGSLKSDEFAFRHLDGTVGYALRSIERLTFEGQDCILSMFIDISQRKKAEETLRMMRFCVDHAGDSLFWVDSRGRILYANDAACADRGYSREELLAMTVFELTIASKDDLQMWEQHFEELKSRGTMTIEARHRTKDGREFPVEINANYVHIDDREFNCAFVRDVSERQHLQAQLLHAQKLESLGIMAGGIAHDFNNLLTSILGYASLAAMELPTESSVRPMLGEIESAAQRAADLTDQMLAYSGKGQFTIQPIRLNVLVDEMMRLLKTVISKKANVVIELEPASIDADPTQIRQVVMNVITNASDALNDHAGEIRISTGHRDVDATYFRTSFAPEELSTGTYAFIKVGDNGCGMSPETLSRIFDPFFTTKFTGRGLGLASVLGIVRGHRGAIKVDSEPARGTIFEVLFPCSKMIAGPHSHSDSELLPRGQGTILVIEDEPTVRNFTKHLLEKAGFGVLTAQDGVDGLDAFDRRSQEIIAVILDLTMPQKDGLEVLRELRRLTTSIPIMVMSGYSEHEVSLRCENSGASGFIQKPFQPRDFIKRICKMLDSESTIARH